MLFNSFEFAVFLPIVFFIYWFVANKNLVIQNAFLLIFSYIFYGWWDWRFLLLLVILSLINYSVGIWIEKNKSDFKRKFWLIIGLIANIGALAFFKYYNFFIDSFIDLVFLIGYNLPRSTTKILLPLGISFYVFLSLSYIIDIFRSNLKATRNIVEVLLALSFFPIILAGPIQQPSSLLPKISHKRDFNYSKAIDGLKQILWGLFAKVVIADNLTLFVDNFFSDYSQFSGSTLALGALFFTVQIYADFSGYSNIAIGVAKLLGFDLIQNFAYPYFSRDITEFWKRWHISLTAWFRDYVFLPLSFSLSMKIRGEKVLFIKKDLFIYSLTTIMVWLLTGLWHGANYTYIFWGLIHGFLLIIYRIQIKPRKKLLKSIGMNNKNSVIVLVETLLTLFFIINAWIFFRAESITDGFSYLDKIFSNSLLTIPAFQGKKTALIVTFLSTLFLIIEWLNRLQPHGMANFGSGWKKPFRWAVYYALIIAIVIFSGESQQFIYFQF